MIIRKVDANNDWSFGKGLSDYAADEQAIEQNIKTRILSWVGDCFFALPEGVDWRNRLEIGQQTELLEEVKSIILQSFGVVGINSLTGVFTGSTRNFLITYNIQTIFSPSFQSTIIQNSGVVS